MTRKTTTFRAFITKTDNKKIYDEKQQKEEE